MTAEKKIALERITDKMDYALNDLIGAYHELEELRCGKQCRKLDTINGKLYNLIGELVDKARK